MTDGVFTGTVLQELKWKHHKKLIRKSETHNLGNLTEFYNCGCYNTQEQHFKCTKHFGHIPFNEKLFYGNDYDQIKILENLNNSQTIHRCIIL